MKMKRNIFGFMVVLLYSMICFIIANTTYADTYNIDGYTVSQNNNIISVTDSQTGLSAYLDITTGTLTDIDGTVSNVEVNNSHDYIPDVSNGNSYSRATAGFRRGAWNYVTSTTYNLGYVQSVQAAMLKIMALVAGPAKPFINAAGAGLGLAAAVNKNVTVKLSQYYDPAQPTKIKEVVVTYANGKQIGSTSYVRNIY